MPAYATRAELASLGLPASALSSVVAADQDAHLLAASERADGYLRTRYTLPLVEPIPSDLKDAVVGIACYTLMMRRGYNPESGADAAIRVRYEDAIAWLQRVGDGRISPSIIDTTPAVSEAGVFVHTSAKRGW